jgi:hypothetical protein
VRSPTIVCSLMIPVLSSDEFSRVLVSDDLSASLDLNYVFRGFDFLEAKQLGQSHFRLSKVIFQQAIPISISISSDRILVLSWFQNEDFDPAYLMTISHP